MAYDPDIPQPGDLISVSQAQILANFQALDVVFTDLVPEATAFAENHYAPGDPNEGKHKYVVIPNTTAPTTAANEAAVSAADYSGRTDLVFTPESAGTNERMTGPSTRATAGYMFLQCGAGGMYMQWNTSTGVWNGVNTISFPVAFSGSPYGIFITQQVTSAGTSTREFCQERSDLTTASQWVPRLIGDGGGVVGSSRSIRWLAIGPA